MADAQTQATATHGSVTVELVAFLRGGRPVYKVRVFRAGNAVPEVLESHVDYARAKGFFDGVKAARGLW